MPSRLTTATATLETVVEAITPPTDAARTYRKLDARAPREGARGHRQFRFEPSSADLPIEQGESHTVFQHRFEMRIAYSARGKSYDDLFAAVVNEAVLIANTVNTYGSSWGAGVSELRIDTYRREDLGGDDLEIVFDVLAECEENEGY